MAFLSAAQPRRDGVRGGLLTGISPFIAIVPYLRQVTNELW